MFYTQISIFINKLAEKQRNKAYKPLEDMLCKQREEIVEYTNKKVSEELKKLNDKLAIFVNGKEVKGTEP